VRLEVGSFGRLIKNPLFISPLIPRLTIRRGDAQGEKGALDAFSHSLFLQCQFLFKHR